MDQDQLPQAKGGSYGTLQVVRTRLRQIAESHGVDVWQVLFILGMANDDLSVYMDPDFYTRHAAVLTALAPGGRYAKVQAEIEALLEDIRRHRLMADIPSWQSGRCARCDGREAR